MKQVVQNAGSGELTLRTVPDPQVEPGHLLVRSRASLISAGTERQAVEFARKNLLEKARARPDLVRKTIDKFRRDGLAETVRAVMTRLDEPTPLGYSASGVVAEVGAGLEGRYRPGQRVAVSGAGWANHAEWNAVPENLAAPVPDGVADEEACYAAVCAIALHGVRLTRPELGAWCAVIGVGLVGQLAAQFLTLSGVRVLKACCKGGISRISSRSEASGSESEGLRSASTLLRLLAKRVKKSRDLKIANNSCWPLLAALTPRASVHMPPSSNRPVDLANRRICPPSSLLVSVTTVVA